MKKILIAIMILFASLLFTSADVSAVNWKVTNQVTVAWDASTILVDGSAIPANHSVKYKVYLANAVTDPEKSNPALIEETDQLQSTITLNVEGKYFVGVSATRYDENGVLLNESEINWSDINGEMTPNPFGLAHYLLVAPPANLR